jgi:predicted dehydrogenase
MTLSERVILVGAGGFGETWWTALDSVRSRLEVAAVADPDPAARARAAARFGVSGRHTATGLTGDLIQAVQAEVVIDSAPPVYRRDHALTSLAHGVHVLAAKPLGRSWAEAAGIVAAAGAGGSVSVAQQMRYFPCFTRLRQLLSESRYGPVLAVSVRMALDGRGWVPGMAWRLAMDHPLLLEAGIHHLDLLRWCLGTRLHVLGGVESNPPWSPFRTGAEASLLLRTAEGVPVRYDATFAPRAGCATFRFDSGWEIDCADARLTVTDGAIYVDGAQLGPGPTPEPVSLDQLNRELLGDWLAAREEGRPAPFGGADNLSSMALLDQAVQAVERESADPVLAVKETLR